MCNFFPSLVSCTVLCIHSVLLCLKNAVSDSPRLMDFSIGLGNYVVNLPDGQVAFLRVIQIIEEL